MSRPILLPPAGAESEFNDDSTLDKDVFDGIEDIYLDLEATPAPPKPKTQEELLQSMINESMTSGGSSVSSTSSVGINKLEDKEGPVETPGFPYACGVGQNSKLASMWNTFNVQSYFEMNDSKEVTKQQTATPPAPVGARQPTMTKIPTPPNTDGETQNPRETIVKMRTFTEEDGPVIRDTIIHHTIDDEPEVVEEPEEKPSFLELLKHPSLFAARSEPKDENKSKNSSFVGSLKEMTLGSSYEDDDANEDEIAIRNKKMQKYQPSFWTVMGRKKTCGVSHRLLLLVSINVFAFMLLVIMITQFTKGQNKNAIASDSQAADAPSLEEPTAVQDNELLSLCDVEGITKQDGVILEGNKIMEKGDYFCSPSKTHMVGLMDDLAIANIETNEVIWAAGVTGGARVSLMDNGSMIIQNDANEVIWSSGAIPDSAGFYNHKLVFWEENEGLIVLQQTPTMGVSATPYNFWMEGSPEFERCKNCQSQDLKFPVRGTFYFPTFDGTERAWQDMNGQLPVHFPSLGFYSSSDPSVVEAHIEAMDYGNIDLGIAHWMGAGSNYDRSRITMLLDETAKQNSNLKWTISYEVEQLQGAVSAEQIQGDLEYLQKWFAGHKSWAHVDGKSVLYVNNDAGCDATERWATAEDWYVVLKIFDGYEKCEFQPDSWHDQQIDDNNDGVDVQEGLYHNLAPGHWKTGRRRPDMDRLGPRQWCANVREMTESTGQWHLITSFNDRNRGTSIEPSLDWRSNTRYGFYLDCLADPMVFL